MNFILFNFVSYESNRMLFEPTCPTSLNLPSEPLSMKRGAPTRRSTSLTHTHTVIEMLVGGPCGSSCIQRNSPIIVDIRSGYRVSKVSSHLENAHIHTTLLTGQETPTAGSDLQAYKKPVRVSVCVFTTAYRSDIKEPAAHLGTGEVHHGLHVESIEDVDLKNRSVFISNHDRDGGGGRRWERDSHIPGPSLHEGLRSHNL